MDFDVIQARRRQAPRSGGLLDGLVADDVATTPPDVQLLSLDLRLIAF